MKHLGLALAFLLLSLPLTFPLYLYLEAMIRPWLP